MSKRLRKNEIKEERNKINTIQKKLLENNLQQFETIRHFGDNIFNGKITLPEADKKTKARKK